MKYITVEMVMLFWCHCYCVEVHFEAADSGFFLKHSRQPPVAPEISHAQQISPVVMPNNRSFDFLLSVDRFTVVQTTQPASIRASYGPFSTKQTVPARFIVPDAIENQEEYLNNTTAALIELQQSNLHLDISAHLVRPIVSRDSPVLRVLFHAGADPGGHLQRQKLCVLLHVTIGTEIPLKGRCMPEGEDGVCVAEVVIPSYWWPPLLSLYEDGQSNIHQKAPQKWVQISYSVFEPPSRFPEQCEPKVQIQPLTSFAKVPLMKALFPFKNLRLDERLTLLMPQNSMYPLSKVHVLVFLHLRSDKKIATFTLRAKVKSGVKILGATSSSDLWNISFEKENQKHTTARVTALNNDKESNKEKKDVLDDESRVLEIFSWHLEIANDTKEAFGGGKIVWTVNYVYDDSNRRGNIEKIGFSNEENKKKIISKFEINKDDIQAVLPMAKSWELMNTAVLTGRQVSQAMKVFIVSQAGKVADVTLQSSCHADDESVIKVSSSCSSVYVDGSEIRGSSNASIVVKYGTYIGLAQFIVWMPEFPVEVYISDFRLSQIKGWRVSDESNFLNAKQTRRRRKRSFVWGQHISSYSNNFSSEKTICRARYQQSPVEVYARFLAIDQNSGRISYFISRRTGLRITDLVQPLLRVADPKIANLKGKILQGKSMGRTDVQVLSPVTGRVIGSKEIRVGSDKVSLTKLIVRVVSGLQLTIIADNAIENGYVSETSVTHKLTAQYQEGLLDIDLEFSDGTRTPLRDISVEDYFLLVESLDTEVVAFAPMLASHHPRVIAVGEGNGDLLRVTLLLSEDCRVRRNAIPLKQIKTIPPLASALASVEVDFNNRGSINKQESVQNDGTVGRDRKGYSFNGDLSDIIVGIPLRDTSNFHQPTIQARQHSGKFLSIDNLHGKIVNHTDMTSIEAGMYVLLTAFCFAIVVFVISCVVYASKFRPVEMYSGNDQINSSKNHFRISSHREPKLTKEPTSNVHDWVWLGRSTMDRTSLVFGNTDREFGIHKNAHIRITNNPIIWYSNPNNNLHNVIASDPQLNSKDVHSQQLFNNSTIVNGNEKVNISYYPSNDSSVNYRPPIPPHRNIEPQTIVNKADVHTNALINAQQSVNNVLTDNKRKMDYQLQSINKINENADLQVATEANVSRANNANTNNVNLTQDMISAEKKPQSPEQLFLPHNICTLAYLDENILHNAERLVENSVHHKGNVFQFDSLTPRKLAVISDVVGSLKNDENSDINLHSKKQVNVKSLDDYGFVTPNNESSKTRRYSAKRATVVGNPMFSSSAYVDIGATESFGIDGLDMNYEEIVKYFDNLKESNA